MKEYYLLTKEREYINVHISSTIEESIVFFSEIKKLSKEDLLKIFIVTDQI